MKSVIFYLALAKQRNISLTKMILATEINLMLKTFNVLFLTLTTHDYIPFPHTGKSHHNLQPTEN